MNIRYFECPTRDSLMQVVAFEGNYFEDDNVVIDVIGHINLNPPIELEEGQEDTREPRWSKFLFNVQFKGIETDLFDSFAEIKPKTPYRTFL